MESSNLPMPDWVRWIAQDQNGAWWGYSVEPLRHDTGWYENEVGRYIRLGTADGTGWENSLRRVAPRQVYPSPMGIWFSERVARVSWQGARTSHSEDYGEESQRHHGARGAGAVAEFPLARGIKASHDG